MAPRAMEPLPEEAVLCLLKLLCRRWGNLPMDLAREIKHLARPPHPVAVIFKQALRQDDWGKMCMLLRRSKAIYQDGKRLVFVTQAVWTPGVELWSWLAVERRVRGKRTIR